MTRSAHGRRRAPRRRAPSWFGRTALALAGVLALAGGTGAAALVDAVGDVAADARVSAGPVELDGVPVEDRRGTGSGAHAEGTAARTEGV